MTTTDPSPEKINIAIAEFCGKCTCTTYSKPGDWQTAVCDQCGKNPFHAEHNLLSYCSDLNAIHLAEKSLSQPEYDRFAFWLAHECELGTYLSATALERAKTYTEGQI